VTADIRTLLLDVAARLSIEPHTEGIVARCRLGAYRLSRLEAKVEAHRADRDVKQIEMTVWQLEGYAAYLDGLSDALAIMQGREPRRPDPVPR
jgi:hypothetical protein